MFIQEYETRTDIAMLITSRRCATVQSDRWRQGAISYVAWGSRRHRTSTGHVGDRSVARISARLSMLTRLADCSRLWHRARTAQLQQPRRCGSSLGSLLVHVGDSATCRRSRFASTIHELSCLHHDGLAHDGRSREDLASDFTAPGVTHQTEPFST